MKTELNQNYQHEKGNLTKMVNMKKVTLMKQGSVLVKWMKQNQNRNILVLPVKQYHFPKLSHQSYACLHEKIG